jgi:transposase
VLSEFRDRLRVGGAEAIWLNKLLERCRELGLVKARGKQRTSATRVLAAIRVLNRLELVGETLRAALNALATEAPVWLQSGAPHEWYMRYGRRIEACRRSQPNVTPMAARLVKMAIISLIYLKRQMLLLA